MAKAPTVRLSSGHDMPILGLGTFCYEDDRAKLVPSIKTAVAAGYRMFDTSPVHENEEDIGKAVREVIAAGLVKREELFIVTRLWMTDFHKEHVLPALNK